MESPIALITGASRGIGRAVALQLAEQGYCVILNYLSNRSAAEEVAELITSRGGHGLLKGFDVAKPAEVEAAVKDISTSVGPIRVLVNNAAMLRDHLLMRMPDQAWHDVINTDLNGVYYCTKAVVRSMAGKRFSGRRIINIVSIAGETGNAGQANYVAAKAGVIGFTKALARELAPLGITVNAVAPGAIRTDAVKHFPLPLDELLQRIPLRRLGEPQEVAAIVSFLASERSSYMTGQVIRVDGGVYM